MLRLIILFFVVALASCSIYNGATELCFIGDSITYQWDLNYYFPGFITHKHAEGGAGIDAIDKWNLSNCEGIPTIFLMGTNDIGNVSLKDENASQKRKEFVGKLVPKLERIKADPLLLLSILPRNSGGMQKPSVNQNIELLNEEIQNALDSNAVNFKYIDAFYYYVDSDYQINKTLYKDGVHLTPEGYEILSKLVLQSL